MQLYFKNDFLQATGSFKVLKFLSFVYTQYTGSAKKVLRVSRNDLIVFFKTVFEF